MYRHQVYLVMVLAMILAVFFAQIHPHYLSKQWQQLPVIIFCIVASYGLIPTKFQLKDVLYISKVPERYFPGQLNYLGSSHQVLVIVMFYWWHQAALFILTHRHSHPCPDLIIHT